MPETEPKLKNHYFVDFFQFVKPYKRPLVIVYILYLVNSLLNIIPALSVRFYIDTILSGKDSSFLGIPFKAVPLTVHGKIVASVIFFSAIAVIIVAANLVGVIMWRLSTKSLEKVMFDIKITIHDHINKLSLSYFNSERVGTIMTKAVGDVGNLGNFIRQSFNMTYSIVQFLITPFLMIALSPVLFLAVLIPVPLMVYAFWSIRMKLQPMYKEQREYESLVNSQIQEVITGIREIKAFNMEDRSSEMYRDVNMRTYDIQNRIMKVFSFNHQLQYGAKDLSTILIAVLGGVFMVIGWGGVTIGTITAFIALCGFFYAPISGFLGFFDIMQRGLVSLERILDFLRIVPDVKDRKGAVSFKPGSVKGNVVYDNVGFSYESGPEVLHGISFSAAAGEKIAIVGASGSGKSTLLSLLPRFYDVQSGSITIDGTDIRNVSQSSLRSRIGMVFQESFLFYGSILDNLRYVNQTKSEQEIIDACKAANIYETILEFPEGLDSTVGERGVRVPAGSVSALPSPEYFLRTRRS